MTKRLVDGEPKSCDTGPSSLQQLWHWPGLALERLASWGLLGNVAKKLERGLEMTTAYSGVGSVETALDFIQTACVRRGLDDGCVEVMSACDVAEHCRKVLLAHPIGTSRAACVSAL